MRENSHLKRRLCFFAMMNTMLFRITIFCTAALLYTVVLQAQPRFEPGTPAPYESDILSARPVRVYLGVALGAYAFQHQGSFSPACDCEFSGENGIHVLYAGELSVQFPKLGFAIRGLVSLSDFSAEFNREESRMSVPVGDGPDVLIDYRNTSNVKLRYLNIAPSFAYYFTQTDLYLYAGLEFGIPLEVRYDHIERILTPGYAYYDGTTENVLLPETDIPGGGLRLALPFGVGYDFHLGSLIVLTPQAGVSVPLTPVSTQHSSWRVISEYGMLLFKVRL